MSDKVLLRSEVDEKYTWNLKDILSGKEEFDNTVEDLKKLAAELEEKYKGNLNSSENINSCLDTYRVFFEKKILVEYFASLAMSTDVTDSENQSRMEYVISLMAPLDGKLSFINSEILQNDKKVIEDAISSSKGNAGYLKELLRIKPHVLSPENERLLSLLSPTLEAMYSIYDKIKLADLDYEPLEINGKKHPMSFVLFENQIEIDQDTEKRRKAFDLFSKNLRRYNHTMAAVYNTHIQKEKIIATERGFDSVIDYLLFQQNVSRDLYDRQIDFIMAELSGPMRKYAQLLKKQNNLDRLTFADLKTSIDYDYEPSISIDEAIPYIKNALSIYGEDYSEMVNRAFSERWIDFVNNKGKSSGAFCASPYNVHPYVLISWSERMMEVFVLAHELGHAGHFYLCGKEQTVFDTEVSSYFVEAPSTMNELLMANYLTTQKSDDLRFKRWVLASMISRTYYHNFVTHLLEAHFQREVYKIVDAGGSLQANDLNDLKLKTLKEFWGDTVEMTEGAELTWMRQPHYYMGLYPYTYSAGLTVATAVNQRILKEGKSAVEDWKKVLKAGSTLDSVGLAKLAGVDITTDKPLSDTIKYISDMIDEIADITEQIK